MRKKPKNRREQLEQRSREYAARHPEVGPQFDAIVLARIARGARHGGAKAAWEVLRWSSPVGADGKTVWKLPNSYCAYFARKFARMYPQYADFFKFRRLTSEDSAPRELPEPGPSDIEAGE